MIMIDHKIISNKVKSLHNHLIMILNKISIKMLLFKHLLNKRKYT